ncbi:MAG: GyrI-like domain-containing protein [Bacteroidota bacterium]|jgi:AraC family transcriptional regulator
MKITKSDIFLGFDLISEFSVVGFSMQMSMADFKANEVWQKFMKSKPQLKEYDGSCYYDVNIYSEHYFESYNPTQLFDKFAGVKSDSTSDYDFEKLIIPGGRYAVFIHEGLATDINKTFQYIFVEWLVDNDEQLDNRPHFMKLPIDYDRNNLLVREEIYIPLR